MLVLCCLFLPQVVTCLLLPSPPLSGPFPAAQPLMVHWKYRGNQLKEYSTAEWATSKAEEDNRCRRYKECVHLVIH